MTIARAPFERATDGIYMPASVRMLLQTLWRVAEWATGKVPWAMSWRRLRARAQLPESTVEWGMRWLQRAGLVVVVERDNTGSYLELDLPDHLRERIGLPTHAEEEWERARSEDAAEAGPAWHELPEARGVLGRLVSLAQGISRAAGEAVVAGALSLGGALAEDPAPPAPQPAYRAYAGRPNAEPPPLSETERRAIWQHYTGVTPKARAARVEGPSVDPALHPDARQVGALYESREEVEELREARRGPVTYDGIGDQAPHRAVWNAYRQAYRRQNGREPTMRSSEHKGIQLLLQRFGLDGALKVVGVVDWNGSYIGLWDLCWAIRWGETEARGGIGT